MLVGWHRSNDIKKISIIIGIQANVIARLSQTSAQILENDRNFAGVQWRVNCLSKKEGRLGKTRKSNPFEKVEDLFQL